jgi:hypothetical protein
MAKPSAKVVLNRGKLDAAVLAVADGFLEVGKTIVELAGESAPDSPYDPYPTGQGLPNQGGVLVSVNGAKTAGWSQRGTQPKMPRAARGMKQGIVTIVGFGYPARFAEMGTVRTPAHPFLAPARDQVKGHIPEIVGEISRPTIGGPR